MYLENLAVAREEWGMRASIYLEAKACAENGIIIVATLRHDSMSVVGASCPVSVSLGKSCNSFFISPKEEKEGIVALSIAAQESNGKQSWTRYYDFILSVRSPKGGKPVIELSEFWIPPAERLPEIVEHSALVVRAGGEVFTNSRHKFPEPTHFVPNPNLLCKFLVGEVTSDDLWAAATAHEKEMSAREMISELERTIAGLLRFEEINADLWRKVSELERQIFAYKRMEGVFFDRIVVWQNIATGFHNAASRRIFLRRGLKSADAAYAVALGTKLG